MRKFWAILFGLQCLMGKVLSQEITYRYQIAPILAQHCATCHQKGGPAPFSLASYAEVNKHAKMALFMIEQGLMPPWRADPQYRDHANRRSISPEETNLLRQWIETGMAEGQGRLPISAGIPQEVPLLAPNLILSLPKAIEVNGGNKDIFAWIKFPYELPSDTSVNTLVFHPGDPQRVHHANIMVYAAPEGIDIYAGNQVWIDGEDGSDAEEALGLSQGNGSDPKLVFVDGWVPGVQPRSYPEGTGFRLPKRGWIVLQTIHYGPSPDPSTDSSYVSLWFGPKPAKKLQIGIIGSASMYPVQPDLILPPNEITTFNANMPVQDTMYIHQVLGHMHLLGKEFKAWLTDPEGNVIPLLRIPEWDFNWQEFYVLDPPQKVLPGSTIHIQGTFDNTSDNPNNPNDPPIQIRSQGNMETRDEMLQLIFRFTR